MIAGGHSIDTLEPIYGLVGIGLVHPDNIKRNSTARAGDVLILSKPLGVGILSAALKKNQLSPAGYAQMLDCTTRLNTPGTALGALAGVHAMTDVTGFGLAGHLLEICRGASLGADIAFASIPQIGLAQSLAAQGTVTGASHRNWDGYGAQVLLPMDFPAWQKNMLTDPQTSGGLLVSCAAETAQHVLALLHAADFPHAAVIGTLTSGAPQIRVR